MLIKCNLNDWQGDVESAASFQDCLQIVGQDVYDNLITNCVDDIRVNYFLCKVHYYLNNIAQNVCNLRTVEIRAESFRKA